MRAFARGGCQTLGLRAGRLCCDHGRPFLYGMAYVTRLPTSPGRPRDRFRVHPRTNHGVTALLETAMLAAPDTRLPMAVRQGMVNAHGPSCFGVLLLQYRTTAGLSQDELADRAGLSRRGISDLERGQRRWPYPATVRRLADALGLGEADRADLLGAARTPGRDRKSV